MRKSILRSLSIFLSVFFLLGAIPIGASALESDVIYNDDSGIPDPLLYNCLLNDYDTNKDGLLQKEEALKVKLVYYNCLELDDPKPIYSLKGLNKCSNISEVIILYNNLTTLEGIEGLKLKLIRVHSNNLTDISAISGMSDTLETLNVQNNQLSKLPDLTNFSKLEVRTDTIVQCTTDFEQNKLSRKELSTKLPKQLHKWIDIWMSGDKQKPDPENMNLDDTNTGIEVEGLMHPDATLNVESVENSVENAVSSFNITLIKDGNIIQPDGTITISIPSEYGNCEVFWIKDDGTKVNMNAEYVDGKYIFTTDHLSIYALVRDIVPTETVPEPTVSDPVPTETVPEPTVTDPVPTETVPEPTVTDPVPTETVPEPTVTDPLPTETVPEPTVTDPVPTGTVPEPTVTDPVPTETVPEPTVTDPVPTETVPEPTVTDPITTEPTDTEPTTTAPVATPDTPSNGNNGSNGSSSNTPSGNSSNTNTSNGAVATGDMFGIDNSILIALILAATTAMIIARKKRKDSSK